MPDGDPHVVANLDLRDAAALQRAKVRSIAAQVEEFEELLPYLTYQERMEIDRLLSSVYTPIWEPFEGPQSIALDCMADELFYGGAAGGGKTDLLLGCALTRHWRSVIFRREYAELKGIRERAQELYEDIGRFNGQLELWRITDGEHKGVRIEFGACQNLGDERKFQGRPHDLKAFDEITQFTEEQFRFLITWNRTSRIGQRSRVIATGNPPVNSEGRWVVDYWAPWLDPRHPNPAKEGELRYFITVPLGTISFVYADSGEPVEGFSREVLGHDIEVPDSRPIRIVEDGEEPDVAEPKSRTFIRARVEDNPRLMETGYRRTLQGLPEPLRSRMLRGDFGVGEEDNVWQVIPTDWVLQAQARWAPTFELYLGKAIRLRRERQQEWAKKKAELDAQLLVQAKDQVQKDQEGIKTGGNPESGADVVTPSAPTPVHPGARSPQIDPPFPPTRLKSKPLPESLLKLSGVSVREWTRDKVDKKQPLEEDLPENPEMFSRRLERAQREGAIGVDISRGGRDYTIIAERLENWFASLTAIPGSQTPDGAAVIQALVNAGFSGRRIQVDVTGVGTGPVDIGLMHNMNVIPMVFAGKSEATDKSGKLRFANLRAEWFWKFREALDPVTGTDIALPPDPQLLADLCAPLWSLTARGILVEAKEHIKDRLKRSPDRGEAVVLAHARPYTAGLGFLHHVRDEVETAKAQLERPRRSPNEN